MCGRVGSWHITNTSGCAPWRSPSVTPAKSGAESKPAPRRHPSGRHRWREPAIDRAGHEVRHAPRRSKRRRPRSGCRSGRCPEIGLVAPRRISVSSASAVNILPIEQSVPTASSRCPDADRPCRCRTPASDGARRTECAPMLLRSSEATGPISEPVVQAAGDIHAKVQRLQQVSRQLGAKRPPRIGDADDQGLRAAPQPLPPRSCPAMPRSALQPSRRNWPTHQSRRQRRHRQRSWRLAGRAHRQERAGKDGQWPRVFSMGVGSVGSIVTV